MVKLILIFLFLNLFIGFIITFISRNQYPYEKKQKKDSASSVISQTKKINTKELENETKEQNRPIQNSVNQKDEDLIKRMAEKLIPSEDQYKDPKKQAAKDMGEHIKEYVDSHPDQATKVFRSWMNSNLKSGD